MECTDNSKRGEKGTTNSEVEASNTIVMVHTHIHGEGKTVSFAEFTQNPAALRKDCPFLRCQAHAVLPCVA